MPSSRVNSVVVSTMRDSITTCGEDTSREPTSSLMLASTSGVSLTISAFVRVSTITSPRCDSCASMIGVMALACA